MTTSNSVFLTVVSDPPLDGAGWQVRVLDYRDFTTLVAVIPEFSSLTVGPELNVPGTGAASAGAGSITLDDDHPFWNTTLVDGQPARVLRDYEYLWQAYEDGELRFEWLGRTVEEHLVEDDETRAVSISGPGAAEVLRFARIMPPGFPTPPPDGLDPNTAVTYTNDIVTLGWEFPLQWPAMQMWWALFKAAQSRGTIPWINPNFTDTRDTAGEAWEYVPTIATEANYSGFRPPLGRDLFDFLADCTGLDTSSYFAERVEWIMRPRFVLDARKTIGVHREDTVIFYEGVIQQKERSRLRQDIGNYVAVRDQNGSFSVAADGASMAMWHRREVLETGHANIIDAPRRDAIADIYVQQRSAEKSQWVIKVPYDQPGRRPFRDYQLGDWIGVAAYTPGQPSTVEALRVLAITVNVEDQIPTVELTLQTRLDYRQKQLEDQLTTIINKVNNTTNPVPANPQIPDLPNPGSGAGLVTWDPTTQKWGTIPLGGLGGGQGGGSRVFIQGSDPGGQAKPGDFWFDTNYTPVPDHTYTPDPPKPKFDYIPDTRERVPGTNLWFS